MRSRRPTLFLLAMVTLAAAVNPAVRAAVPPCPTMTGSGRALQAGTVLLVGELHGTAQSPAFALGLVCRALEAGLSLQVALEFPVAEGRRLEAFVASDGGDAARRELLEGAPWKSEYQYGLTSEAMLALLEGLRALRAAGRHFRILAFDRPGEGGSQARDRRMAAFLADQLRAETDAFTLVLTGNIHSRIAPGTPWNPAYEPMGYLLAEAIGPARVRALNVAHAGGTAWICQGSKAADCGIRQVAAQGPPGEGITWDAAPEKSGHHGYYHVGDLVASPPARGAAPDARGPEEPEAAVLWQFDTGG